MSYRKKVLFKVNIPVTVCVWISSQDEREWDIDRVYVPKSTKLSPEEFENLLSEEESKEFCRECLKAKNFGIQRKKVSNGKEDHKDSA